MQQPAKVLHRTNGTSGLAKIETNIQMSVIETLTQRNEAFASSRFSADLKIMPSMKTMIIGCVDPRVDPSIYSASRPVRPP